MCAALRNMEVAGNPDEYFGPMHVPKWQDKWGVSDPCDYVCQVIDHGSTRNGVFGVKIMKLYWDHFLNTIKQANGKDGLSAIELITSTFPNMHYIWITRRNKIRQGISWCKAMQGIPWTWAEPEPPMLEKQLEFQFDIIDHFIAETILHEAAWQEFFTENGITPFVVVYEDFVRSIEETTRTVLDFLDILWADGAQFRMPTLKQQADGLSEKWIQLYQNQKELEWQEKGWNRIGY